jgi:hypothetical protein
MPSACGTAVRPGAESTGIPTEVAGCRITYTHPNPPAEWVTPMGVAPRVVGGSRRPTAPAAPAGPHQPGNAPTRPTSKSAPAERPDQPRWSRSRARWVGRQHADPRRSRVGYHRPPQGTSHGDTHRDCGLSHPMHAAKPTIRMGNPACRDVPSVHRPGSPRPPRPPARRANPVGRPPVGRVRSAALAGYGRGARQAGPSESAAGTPTAPRAPSMYKAKAVTRAQAGGYPSRLRVVATHTRTEPTS